MEIYETGNYLEKTDKPHSCILIEKGFSVFHYICPFKRAGRTGYEVKYKHLATGLDHVTRSFPSLSFR